MPRQLRKTNYFLLFTLFFLLSCTSATQLPAQTYLYVYRFDPPALVEFSSDFQPVKEIPFPIPPDCGLLDIFPAPVGRFLLIEFNCPNGQTVLFLDTSSALSAGSGSVTQPITDSDSHFLAWTPDGKAAYLKVDSLGDARVMRISTDSRQENIDITGWTYDLATRPASNDFIYSFSGGLGQGSELTLVQHNGRDFQQLYVDLFNYVSFARFSLDGHQILFIKTPDSPVPFTIGELWVMGADGTNPRKLADVDAGHGYAANWSPDGMRIAFVRRENPEDESANQSAESLISNIYLVDVQSGEQTPLTHFTDARVETPHWSPEGNTLAFNTVLNGRMETQIVDVNSGKILPLLPESVCCPAWLLK